MKEFLKLNSAGDVIEYPVYEIHIRNRGLRLDMFEEVVEVQAPTFNPQIDGLRKLTPVQGEDGRFYQAWDIYPLSDGRVLDNKKARLAEVRWEHETGGLTVEGTEVRTDRESQSTISNAFVSLSEGLVSDVEFKAVDGWSTVDMVTLRPIAQAVATHVQRCFKSERGVAELLETLVGEDLRTADVRGLYFSEYATLAGA